MKRAHLTISRPTCSDGSRYISIEIGDRDSSLQVLRLRVGLDDFACALTGAGHTPAVVEQWIGKKADKIGKHHHVRELLLQGRPPYSSKDDGRAWVRSHPMVKAAVAEGWEVQSDGTTTQQPDRDHHRIIMCRYEDHPQERAQGVRP